MAIDNPAHPTRGSAAPLTAHAIQPLLIDPADHPRGKAHLSAASGLVRMRQRLYVVADDELHLAMFDDPGSAPTTAAADSTGPAVGTLLRLLEGDLPKDAGKRKKAKPDFESLAALPPLPGCPAGALLALGSGSRPNRETGVLIALNAQGVPNGRMAQVDLAALYAPLHKRFADLNIEGALVVSGELLLLQRGNKGHAVNACIRYDWNLMAPWLAGLQPKAPAAKSVQLLELGLVEGVPLGFSDGAALHGGAWAFSAVAESTDDSYLDGACVGSAIGTVGADGELQRLHLLHGAPKVEGLAVLADGDGWLCTLVTDPDDPAVAAQMLQVRLPGVNG
ncbi:MAG: hypothetical protein KJ614_06095 [Gammaproteobacteria bacterium]|uniref:DUF6910 family protein n=1 Tax=Rhodoferax sp. TaxID=50421 RepID=UPI0017F915B2|nr:hypothetical protein [Rhodoferax sp.]MBU3898488.1 hypothetical protein [Gammaproteobacteria bacterium]MBA3058514.1 hypothetical protein [Rhodoferax sp.]MBU3997815.1 hypothetical protein [Gammaproteobacteria bacterium]MBU4079263.1 hypothetical protein [Gammaproteobacteria bacterium]MBU4112207.1 hypothetical protein [Gammaproteobacteria bacterium]